MKFNIHMTVRKDGALGLGWPYLMALDADSEAVARTQAIEYVRAFHNLETLEIRHVSSASDQGQPQ